MYNNALLSIGYDDNSFVNVGDGDNNNDINTIDASSVCDMHEHEDNCGDNGNTSLHYYL